MDPTKWDWPPPIADANFLLWLQMGETEVLPDARLPDLGRILGRRGYQVFLQGGSLYAFKGLAGKLGPIGWVLWGGLEAPLLVLLLKSCPEYERGRF